MEPHRHSLKVTFTEHRPIFIEIYMNHAPDFSKLLFSSYVFSGKPMRIEKLLFRLTCNFIRPSKEVKILFSLMKSKLLVNTKYLINFMWEIEFHVHAWTNRLWMEQFIWDVSFLDLHYAHALSPSNKLWLLSKCVGAMIYQKTNSFSIGIASNQDTVRHLNEAEKKSKELTRVE